MDGKFKFFRNDNNSKTKPLRPISGVGTKYENPGLSPINNKRQVSKGYQLLILVTKTFQVLTILQK